jgi:hypothetical protein
MTLTGDAHQAFPCDRPRSGRLVEQPAFSARLRRRRQVVTVREGPVRLGRHERREAMVGGRFVLRRWDRRLPDPSVV